MVIDKDEPELAAKERVYPFGYRRELGFRDADSILLLQSSQKMDKRIRRAYEK